MMFSPEVQARIAQSAVRSDINERALWVLPAILRRLVPGGEFRRDEYHLLNPNRPDRSIGSLSINCRNALWCDRGHEAKGRDAVSFFAYVLQRTDSEIVAELTSILNTMPLPLAAPPEQAQDWTPLVPVPSNAPDIPRAHIVAMSGVCNFAPTHFFRYENADGALLFLIVRFERAIAGKTKKEERPFVFAEHVSGARAWRCKGPGAPYSLFNIPAVQRRPDAPILVVEGEKTALAAERRFPQIVAVTSSFGAGNARHSDWAPLRGREVVIWPDNDEAGAGYARDVEQLARSAGARSIRTVTLPFGLPLKWDLADEVPDWLDLQGLLTEASR